MLAALREGDFSTRARGARDSDALGLALLEVNMLAATLRSQRLSALEATSLLRTVMEEIDVAIFTFDETHRLRLLNRAGERLLAQPGERLLGRTGAELGLEECLGGDATRTVDTMFPGGAGRWQLRRTTFRQNGQPHQLVVLSDLSKALRDEERLAWQRIIRVLGHEINNSLAPIKSIAESLQSLMELPRRDSESEDDVRQGLVGHLESRGLAEPLHDLVRRARAPSGAATRDGGRVDVGAAAPRSSRRGFTWTCRRRRRSASSATATSWISC